MQLLRHTKSYLQFQSALAGQTAEAVASHPLFMCAYIRNYATMFTKWSFNLSNISAVTCKGLLNLVSNFVLL